MRLVKHNAIDNYLFFTQKEKEDLIIQEVSKAFMLYPQATADILEVCKISYSSKTPKDFVIAIEKHGDNLKMLNRLVRLSFLVNKQGDVVLKNHDRNITYRNLMKEGSTFLKNHQDAMKDATLLTRDMMKEKMFSKTLNKSVEIYLNMDGSKPNEQIQVNDNLDDVSKTWRYVLLGGVVIAGIYLYQKFSKR